MNINFVVPVKDEQDTLVSLYERISASVAPLGHDYEVIFIDDGSTDASWQEMLQLKTRFPGSVRAIRFRRNVGKAAALTAGYESAQGDVVFTMDADLQDDPAEIPRFLDKLAEGYDLVSGWKKRRHDPWHKVLPSRVFNKMLSWLSGVRLHDHNCGFKCYRAEVTESLTLYGEMHRMVPALAGMYGFRVTEIVVQHHPREHGTSKYGIKRFFRGFTDMCTVAFLAGYRNRPLHFMGGLAAIMLLMAALSLSVGCFLFQGGALGAGFYALGVAGIASAAPVLALGFLSELLTYRAREGYEANLVVANLATERTTGGASGEASPPSGVPIELKESA